MIVGEDGGGGADFGTHVADGAHAGAGKGLDALSEIFDDGSGASLDGEDVRNLENDVLGGGPARELSGQFNSDNLQNKI